MISALVVAIALVVTMAGAAFAVSSDDTAAATAGATSLSPHVKQHLILLREEEKLARDVYSVLYTRWGAVAFHDIAFAEGHHMAAVKVILDRYGIADPVGANPPGVFTNQKLQAAYAEFVARGSKSLVDAYKVGVVIEKREIALLRDLIGDTVRADVIRMATNLLNGDLKHLAAFNRLLNK
ncbi:MAG: hypothetical protein A2133_01905 [Actinobacteria bacterium RBG_16_64_13]|nr:MAG: hypothetical protein A2133_01905 [Actinobacteria bacterium RBG_16_64_13]